MKPVCVITGGGSGIGLATAKVMAQSHQVVISGRTVARLQAAIAEIPDAHAVACDVGDPASVEHLAQAASALGVVSVVINAAGLAPQTPDAIAILRTNALGPVHVHDAFHPRMGEGGCLIDIGSTGGHMVNPLILPARAYRWSLTDRDRFLRGLVARTRWFPARLRPGLAYCISKHFVAWYARADAQRFGRKGVRVLSVSPGSFETDMGELAKKSGADLLLPFCAIRRYGRVEEIAHLLAMCADNRLGYLTGTDILCDGGCMAGGRSDPLGFLRVQLNLLWPQQSRETGR